MPEVRHAVAADRAAVVEALTLGFSDDPWFLWVFPRPDRRPASLRALFDHEFGCALKRGHAYVVDNSRGAAFWSPPDVEFIEGDEVTGFFDIVRAHDPDRFDLVSSGFFSFLDVTPTGTFFYLSTLALHPDSRGRGLGGPLLSPILETCDRQGLPAYLESSNPRNVSFYERLGFRVTGELPMPEGPTVGLLWRDPA